MNSSLSEIPWTKSQAAHAVEMTSLFHVFLSVDQIISVRRPLSVSYFRCKQVLNSDLLDSRWPLSVSYFRCKQEVLNSNLLALFNTSC
jgi:hypothetical protein